MRFIRKAWAGLLHLLQKPVAKHPKGAYDWHQSWWREAVQHAQKQDQRLAQIAKQREQQYQGVNNRLLALRHEQQKIKNLISHHAEMETL